MKKSALLFIVLSIITFSSGCAFKQYLGPTTGRSADFQFTVARSTEEAFKSVKFDDLSGKKVFVEVNGLTDKSADMSAEEGYIRAEIYRKLFESGAKINETVSDADVRISARLRIAGIDATDRHLPLIYYSVVLRGATSVHMVLYDLKNSKIIRSIEANSAVNYYEIYWFYLFGPVRGMEVITDPDEIGMNWEKLE